MKKMIVLMIGLGVILGGCRKKEGNRKPQADKRPRRF